MIIEQLISNYLDGDLTPEQDLELRNLVSADPAARKSFDEAVLVHIAMRCEDETDVPDDLRAEVFSQVDAIAREDEHLKEATIILRRVSGSAMRRVGAVLAVFLAFWVPIHESQFGVSDPAEYSLVVPAELIAPADVAMESYPKGEQRSYQSPQERQSFEISFEKNNLADADINIRGDAELVAQADQYPKRRDAGFHTPNVTLSSMFSSVGGSEMSSNNDDYGAKSASAGHQSQDFYGSEHSPVTVSTSFSAGLSNSVQSASNVQQMAASFGIGVTEDDIVGLELGSTQYSYATTMSLSSSKNGVVALPDGSLVELNQAKISTLDPAEPAIEVSEFDRTGRNQTFWGAAFYERRFFYTKALSLNGRAGAGVAQDGVVGFGRLTSEVNIAGNVSVLVGAEARAMPFQLGPMRGSGDTRVYGTVFTVLTGIHVRF